MNEPRPGLGHGQSPHITPAAAPHSPGIHPHPQPAVHHGTHPPQHGVLHGAGPVPTMKKPTVIDEPIELEADDVAAPTKSKIVAFGDHATHAAHDWKRQAHKNQTGAVRVRSFHCRLSEQGLEYMDNAINEWLDHHPDIEIKFTSSVVGLFDGKIKEPALILNLWY